MTPPSSPEALSKESPSTPNKVVHVSLKRCAPQSWGEYLEEFEWHHAVTLTYRHGRGLLAAQHDIESGWLRSLARMAQRPLAWFYVLEYTATHHLHAHALVWGTGHLTIAQLERAWKHGHTAIRCYDPTRSFARYVAKDLPDRAAAYDVSRRLPPFLKRAA